MAEKVIITWEPGCGPNASYAPDGQRLEFSGKNISVSDGYHSMDELYAHRIELWIALCRVIGRRCNDRGGEPWRTQLHSDGTNYDGWFILGVCLGGEQITYHVPIDRWDDCSFALDRERAPKWDGHAPGDVLERLKRL